MYPIDAIKVRPPQSYSLHTRRKSEADGPPRLECK